MEYIQKPSYVHVWTDFFRPTFANKGFHRGIAKYSGNINLVEGDADDVDRVLTCLYYTKDYGDEMWEIRRHSSG
jgi:hypothetical protein